MHSQLNLQDLETCQQIKDTPNDGLTRLLEDHGGRARKYLKVKLGRLLSPDEGESLLYDGAYRVLQHIYEFDPHKSSLAAWFTLLTYRSAIDHLRSERRHEALCLDDVSNLTAGGVERSEQFTLAMNEIYDAIEQLPERHRRVFELILSSGNVMSAEEMAKERDISVNTFYRYRSEGLKLMREQLISS